MAWKTVEIGSFLKERGDRFKQEEANTLDLKRIEKIDFQGKIHVIDHKPTKTNMILVKKGDLVISGINVEKGALAVYEEDEDALATIHYSSYEYDENQVDIEYLKWFLKSRTFQDIVKKQVGGGIKTELKPKKFLPLKIQLPGLNEQIDIARKTDNVAAEIDDLSETNNHNQTLLIQLRQAILQEAVQGKLAPQDPNDEPASELLKRIKAEKEKLIAERKIKKQKSLPPITEDEISYELPQGWEWARLGNLTQVITKGSSPKWQGIQYVGSDEGLLFLTSKNVGNYNLILDNSSFVEWKFNEIEPRSILQNGDILMNIVGASIGRTALYDLDEIANINQAVCLIRFLNFFSFDKSYFLHFFNSPVCISYMFDKQVDMARPNLSMGNIERFLVPVPPVAEQKRIVSKVDQLMHLCDELEDKLNQSEKDSEMLMQAVLQEALS